MPRAKKNTSSNTPSLGSIRIIAGKYRGRKLPVITAQGLRPTTDRVKETVFNWLMPYIGGSDCLDCFSGAGSLGFEAASRNANSVTMLELNKQAAQQLKKNKAMLAVEQCEVFQTDTLNFLSHPPAKQYNLVFIDPPFRQQLLPKVVTLLEQGWLKDNALVYVEQEVENSDQAMPSNWQLMKEKVAGQVKYQLYQVCH